MKFQSTVWQAGSMCLLLATAAVFAPVSAQSVNPATAPPANDTATPVPRSFEELDANADGAISKDEAAVDPALTQVFGTLDQDADGKLSESEYSVYQSDGGG